MPKTKIPGNNFLEQHCKMQKMKDIPLEELKHQNSGTEDLIITSDEHGTWIEKEKQDGKDTGSY